jgi:osmotically-inducible protein OsmY
MFRLKPMLLAVLVAGGVSVASAQQDADNSKMNSKAGNKTQSADQAKNNKTDVQLMKDIRRAVVKDKSLSTYAHNVKIVASGGKVTLKGPVKSAEEKAAVAQKATEIAGAANVTDELTIAESK